MDPEPGPAGNGAYFDELHARGFKSAEGGLPSEMLVLDLPGRPDHVLYIIPIHAIDTIMADHDRDHPRPLMPRKKAFLGYWVRRGALIAVLPKIQRMRCIRWVGATLGPEAQASVIRDIRRRTAGEAPVLTQSVNEEALARLSDAVLYLQEVERIDLVMRRVRDNGLSETFLAPRALRNFMALARSGRRGGDGKVEQLADMIDWYTVASSERQTASEYTVAASAEGHPASEYSPISRQDPFTCFRIRWGWRLIPI